MLSRILFCLAMLLAQPAWAALSPPTNFHAQTNAGGTTTLSWDAVTGATGYVLRVHLLGSPYDPCEVFAYCGPTENVTQKILALPPGDYDAWVHAATGESQGITFTVPAAATVSSPTWVTHPVTLQWTANTESDLAGYKVYRGLAACATNPTLAILKDVGNVTSFTDTTIPVDTSAVCYAVTAYDQVPNESALSARAGKTVNLAPGAPTAPSFN